MFIDSFWSREGYRSMPRHIPIRLWCTLWSLLSCYGSQIALSSELQSRIALACTEIELAIKGEVYRPHTPGYDHQQDAYWLADQRQDYLPNCRITPRSTEDVSISVRLLGKHQIPFAVKSGGHSFLSGASNINSGITLDLAELSAIALAEDKKSVLVQPGATWSDVYEALEPHELTAVGGRAGRVGVGGFLLGGGSSWLSNRWGWACDSVVEFEVVLYGNVKIASPTENADLFWALKGGGSNFGIITAARLTTIPQGDVFLNTRSYLKDSTPKIFSALQDFTYEAPNDLGTMVLVSFAYRKGWQDIEAGVAIVNIDNSSSTSGFEHFAGIPAVIDVSQSSSLSRMAFEANQDEDRNARKIKFTLTVHNDAAIFSKVVTVFEEAARSIASKNVIGAFLTLQPLTTSHISGRSNTLGISNTTEPLMLISFEVYWQHATESTYFESFAREVHDTMRGQAEQMGLLHRFVYLNYAASWQEPFSGYGPESLRRLKDVQQRLQRDNDPEGLFKELMPGGKKL